MRTTGSALLVALALAACGPGGEPASLDPTQSGGSPAMSSSPTDPGQPTPATVPGFNRQPGRKPPTGSATPGATTLTGTVTAGIEANCLLLENYLLVGGPRDVLRPGARVTVTGEVRTDVMTTCQQGTPFVVQTARPA